MGSSKKNKKKTKKKTRGSDREWKLEGGVEIENGDSTKQGPTRKFRRTQEKDEKLRRGKLKGEYNNLKQNFVKKMSKGFSIKEILPDLNKLKDKNTTVKKVYVQRKIINSDIPIIDRLQSMVNSSLSKPISDIIKDLKDTDNAMNTEPDNIPTLKWEPIEHESEKLSISNHLLTSNEDNSGLLSDEQSIGETLFRKPEDIPIEETGITELESSSGGNYSWFFSSDQETMSDPDQTKSFSLDWIKLTSCNKYDFFGRLHPQINVKPINSLGHIPGLHKMWRHRESETLSPFSTTILPYLVNYTDMLIDGRNHKNDRDILYPILLHIATHTVRARARVVRHNTSLNHHKQSVLMAAQTENGNGKGSKKSKRTQEILAQTEELDASLAAAIKDQGFTRPRVLILCPFRGSVATCIEMLKEIYGPNTSVSKEEKLQDEFMQKTEEDENEMKGTGSGAGAGGAERSKPEDWKALFNQNVDDDFKLGIQIHPSQGIGSGAEKGVNIRLFCDFFQSDIILASPLGLRLLVESDTSSKNDSFDYLSSIEILFLYQADVLYTQNWDHVEYVLKQTNQLPQSNSNTQSSIDFTRVRPYFLDDKSKYHRQMLVSTHFIDAIIQATFREHACSMSGTVRGRYNWGDGVLNRVVQRARQVFQQVPDSDNAVAQEDNRFQYFCEYVLGPLLRMEQSHTLIVTSSYVDYIRVRNELMRREADAAFVCEYSRESEITRGRSRFYHGHNKLLVYSGRAHFFRRFRIRGARHVIFYSLPAYAHFYPEIVNAVEESHDATKDLNGALASSSSCLVLYTLFDRLILERVVGKARCTHMLSSTKRTFMFC